MLSVMGYITPGEHIMTWPETWNTAAECIITGGEGVRTHFTARLTRHFCSVSIVSTLDDIEWRGMSEVSTVSYSALVVENCIGFYVNTEQIGPMPRLRVNPTILWLPNIVISLVSIIYISSIYIYLYISWGRIHMNWVG